MCNKVFKVEAWTSYSLLLYGHAGPKPASSSLTILRDYNEVKKKEISITNRLG